MFSILNVENVVSPPQKPTVINKYRSDRKVWFFIPQPSKIPIIIHPKKFAISVDQGKLPLEASINLPIRKRKILPKPPPMKIKIRTLIFELDI